MNTSGASESGHDLTAAVARAELESLKPSRQVYEKRCELFFVSDKTTALRNIDEAAAAAKEEPKSDA